MHRRRFVMHVMRVAATLSPAALLPGCAAIIRRAAATCPDDPAESGGVDWIPEITRPVFYGYQDLDVADGAPRPLRVWYPSVDGSPAGAPILKLCVARWPLVLFLHGQPPQDCSTATPTYYRRWFFLPATLARSGFVVVVPQHGPYLPVAGEKDAQVPAALADLDWARSRWAHARWVDQRPAATAVAGHSYGALLGLRVTRARPEIAAFVSFSGTWQDRRGDLPGLATPSFFMWVRNGTGGLATWQEDLDHHGLWVAIAPPKYGAVFAGQHFDYVTPVCGEPRGACKLIESLAGDLAALFITRHVSNALAHIPISLHPPRVRHTERQAFYAGGHLGSLRAVERGAGCRVDLRWDDGRTRASRRLGS